MISVAVATTSNREQDAHTGRSAKPSAATPIAPAFVVSEAALARFCQDSVAHLEWLEAQGTRFASTRPNHKTSYSLGGVFRRRAGRAAARE